MAYPSLSHAWSYPSPPMEVQTPDDDASTVFDVATAAAIALSKEGHLVTLDKLLEIDYDELSNISSEHWFNYSCYSFETKSDFISSTIVPVICGCGIIGILLTMVVLSRKTMCTSTNCYLTALAVADLLFLLILSVRILVDKLASCEFHMSNERVVFSVYTIIFMEIFQYLTVGVTVMLAIERYIAICHPMRAMTICTVKRARIIIILLTVAAVILRSPKFFDIEITHHVTVSGEKIMSVSWVYLYDDRVYNYIVTGVLLTVLPLLSLMILNIRLIQEIRRSSRYLQYHLGTDWRVRSVVSSEELKITMMLISVIIAFFICHVPYMVYIWMVAISNYDTVENSALTNSSSIRQFRNVCHSLLAIKSSSNFILYCWFSEKFWTTFKRIFCLHHCLPKQSSNQPNGYNNNSHNNSHNHVHRPSYYITKETTC